MNVLGILNRGLTGSWCKILWVSVHTLLWSRGLKLFSFFFTSVCLLLFKIEMYVTCNTVHVTLLEGLFYFFWWSRVVLQCYVASPQMYSGLTQSCMCVYVHVYIHIHMGFPGGSAGKESACNVRDPWFNSWVRKFPWRRVRLPTPVFLGFPCGSQGVAHSFHQILAGICDPW